MWNARVLLSVLVRRSFFSIFFFVALISLTYHESKHSFKYHIENVYIYDGITGSGNFNSIKNIEKKREIGCIEWIRCKGNESVSIFFE